MDCRTAGFPVLHYPPEFAQIHVYWVGDAIQPSYPLFSPSPLPSIFPSIRIFSSESALCIRWPKYWSFSFSISLSNEYSELISFRIDWFDLLAVQGTLKSLFLDWQLISYMILYMFQCHSPKSARYSMLGASALGQPRGMVWGRRWEGGWGWGTCVHPWWIHVDLWQNQYNIVNN